MDDVSGYKNNSPTFMEDRQEVHNNFINELIGSVTIQTDEIIVNFLILMKYRPLSINESKRIKLEAVYITKLIENKQNEWKIHAFNGNFALQGGSKSMPFNANATHATSSSTLSKEKCNEFEEYGYAIGLDFDQVEDNMAISQNKGSSNSNDNSSTVHIDDTALSNLLVYLDNRKEALRNQLNDYYDYYPDQAVQERDRDSSDHSGRELLNPQFYELRQSILQQQQLNNQKQNKIEFLTSRFNDKYFLGNFHNSHGQVNENVIVKFVPVTSNAGDEFEAQDDNKSAQMASRGRDTQQMTRKIIENEVIILTFLSQTSADDDQHQHSSKSILKFYGFAFHGKYYSFIYEKPIYGDLHSFLGSFSSSEDKVPLNLVVSWLLDIIQAIEFIHGRGLIHGNLVPQNIFIYYNFQLKITTDLFASQEYLYQNNILKDTTSLMRQSIDGADQSSLRNPKLSYCPNERKVVLLSFIAPEVRMGQRRGPYSDIFAFAMVALFVLSLKLPEVANLKSQIMETLELYFQLCANANAAGAKSGHSMQRLSAIGTSPLKYNIENEELFAVEEKFKHLLLDCIKYDPSLDPDPILSMRVGNNVYGRPSASVLNQSLSTILDLLGGDLRSSNSPNIENLNQREVFDFRTRSNGLLVMNHSKLLAAASSTLDRQRPEAIQEPRSPAPTVFSQQSDILRSDHLEDRLFGDEIPIEAFPSDPYETNLRQRLRASYDDNHLLSSSSEMNYNPRLLKSHSNEFLLTRVPESDPYIRNHHQVPSAARRNVPRSQPTDTSLYGQDNVVTFEAHQYGSAIKHSSYYNYHEIVSNEARQPHALLNAAEMEKQYENENFLLLQQFLRDRVQCLQSSSERYANILMDNDVTSVKILKARLARDENFLVNLGFDWEDALDVAECVEQLSSTSYLTESVSYSPHGYHPNLQGSHGQFIPNSEVSLSHHPADGFLPTEISNLYYEAAQCNNKEARTKLFDAAAKENRLAEGFVMRMYALGQGGIPSNLEIALDIGNKIISWLRQHTQAENKQVSKCAQFLLGVCYSEGLGVPRDDRDAFWWYSQSAEQGFSIAQAYLGYCYYVGLGVEKNLVEAVKWYAASAAQGHASAQCNLGLCYEQGHGVSQNPFEAVRCYKLAAHQGDVTAQYNLAFCYERGVGIEQNFPEAIKWYESSANNGHAAAECNLGFFYEKGIEVPVDLQEAFRLFFMSAQKSYPPAECKVGLCYENGLGVEKDEEMAVAWYKKCADKGYTPGQYHLGYCYSTGTGVEADVAKALEYYQIASNKGYAAAQNNLAYFYKKGYGVRKNLTMAVKLFRLAAEQDYPAAQYNLGYCYEKGLGVPQKLHEMIKWYRLAAENGVEKASEALNKLKITRSTVANSYNNFRLQHHFQ
jgi:TPR repeat protein/serine/threonine protein kinase